MNSGEESERKWKAACVIFPFLYRNSCMVLSVDVVMYVRNKTELTERKRLTFMQFLQVNLLEIEQI